MSTPALVLDNVTKTFKIRQKSRRFRSFLRPVHQEVHAVDGVSLHIEPGEFVGFIGPNGAGKSTTIKMLTGILSRTSGDIKVLGHDPANERHQLAYQIGTVFGQRSQLWYHLPPSDTFEVLRRIYELDKATYQQRLQKLVEAFALHDLLHTPIRKLSLGQRMRCEIAASLLHGPKLIFLDEPTIGLDVIAKQKIREVLKELNQKEGVTILLTSHDAGDIEELCQRTVVINHGKVIFDGTTTKFKRKFVTNKTIQILTNSPAPTVLEPPIGKVVAQTERAVTFEVPTRREQTALGSLLKWATATLDIADIVVAEPPMEEIIAHMYRSQKDHP